MQLLNPFNAQAVDPTQGGSFQQLPLGKHVVMAVASEVKPTADNTGGMLIYELQVLSEDHKGATGPLRLNLYNQSDKARAIAEAQLSALCHVTGIFMVNDSAQLHNIPFGVLVTEQALTPQQVEKKNAGEQVTPFTQVSKILDTGFNEPRAAGQAAPQQAPQQQQAPAPSPAPAAGGWGGQAPAQAPAQAAWGGGGQAAAPSPAPAPAANAWQQGAGAGGKPAWGK